MWISERGLRCFLNHIAIQTTIVLIIVTTIFIDLGEKKKHISLLENVIGGQRVQFS
jgi:hypothetical protein